jgi:hypothetical protein
MRESEKDINPRQNLERHHAFFRILRFFNGHINMANSKKDSTANSNQIFQRLISGCTTRRLTDLSVSFSHFAL